LPYGMVRPSTKFADVERNGCAVGSGGLA